MAKFLCGLLIFLNRSKWYIGIMKETDISASLQYGKVLKKSEYRIISICIFLQSLLPATTIFLIILGCFGYFEWDYETIITLCIANSLFGILMFVMIYLKIYHIKLYKNIELWKKDAIEVVAYAQRIDLVGSGGKPYQVEFTFSVDGKEIKQISSAKGLIMWGNRLFLKYDDKYVKILFSRKYDQVLILK